MKAASGRVRMGKAVPRLTGKYKALCEPCFERGRHRAARHEIAGTPMCQWCALGLPDPEARGMSAGQIRRRARLLPRAS
jgi:hypothetical protein